MSWIGGKKALREIIIQRFPLNYERYIEVFGGGGWVLFGKQPDRFEVYNDYNGFLANLYRCVREKADELMEALKYVINSREDFELVKAALENPENLTDIQKASYFYQLIRYSYASGLTSYGSQPHDIRSNFTLIEKAHQRLANVVIENKDFEPLVKQYDRTESFFYIDPPYYDTEKYYKNVGEGGFKKEDHIRLRDLLFGINGKCLLSYNDCATIRKLYGGPEFYIESVSRLNNIKQRYDNGSEFPELLIANYNLNERANTIPVQMNLFGSK